MLIAILALVSQIAFGSASLAQYTSISKLTKRSHHLVKRGDDSFSGRASFYATGLGACGNTNSDSDFIVALNSPQYNANKWCGKKIKISFGGKTTTATIQDQCPGCPFGALDLSPSLFEFFASKDVGIFYMKWSLEDGSSENPPPPPSPPPPTPTPSPTKTIDSPPQYKPDDQSTQSKVMTSSSPKPTDDSSSLQNNTPSTTTNNPQSQSANNPLINQKLMSGSTQGNSADSSSNHQDTTLKSNQPNFQYASGGNLDAINQLVISFGSLAASSADDALNHQT